ncbi:MAG: DNA mismatch repair endonuclease MutL [Candidatus Thorarchaeota archaeon]|jgi:DNA mismatch repair protein MutL
MSRVRVLDKDLISLISAGEVIEGPSSIVKELIENALDAGATNIEIEIVEGGIDTIIVSDNGSGIMKEDVPVCVLRHSTSKISIKDDIDSISTYGFRGEALASIAAVANLEIVTKYREEDIGTKLVSRIGEQPVIAEVSRPHGTKVIVRDLFSHVPARKKHLGSPSKESQSVLDVIMRHSIIRNDAGFRYVRDGETIVDCPLAQTARDRVLMLWGTDIAKNLVDFRYEREHVIVSGFIVLPPLSRGNRGRQFFSVRARPIEDKTLSLALENAYSTLLMKGRFPICAIDISVDLSRVDANVHPTKREVRIQDIASVAAHLKDAVKEALSGRKQKEISLPLDAFVESSLTKTSLPGRTAEAGEPSDRETKPHSKTLLFEDAQLVPQLQTTHELETTGVLGGVFRVLGQTHDVYLLLEFEDAIVIVDQHAADERIIYEALRKGVNESNVVVQELLEPIVIRLDHGLAEKILNVSDALDRVGYTISSFGGNEILVSSLPEVLGKHASEEELGALVDRIIDIGEKDATGQFMDELVKVTACHSAIRAGQKLSNEEIRDLLVKLSKAPNKYNCCHGRPSVIRISKNELDKKFGRTGPEAIARYKARHGLGL